MRLARTASLNDNCFMPETSNDLSRTEVVDAIGVCTINGADP